MSRAIKDYNAVDWASLYYYDPSVPSGLRFASDRPNAKKGNKAGSINYDPIKRHYSTNVSHGMTNWFSARVIWILHNGYLDKELVIDHINGDPTDNRLENLRAVPQAINNRNATKRRDNNTDFSGVHFTTAKGGKGTVHTYATASWYCESNKRDCKHFAVSKYGLLPAFAMACKYREDMIKVLNDKSYGYSENHGK